jgi:hypothetical protein
MHVLSMLHAQAIPMPPCLLALLHAPCLDPSRPSPLPTYLGPTCYAPCPRAPELPAQAYVVPYNSPQMFSSGSDGEDGTNCEQLPYPLLELKHLKATAR